MEHLGHNTKHATSGYFLQQKTSSPSQPILEEAEEDQPSLKKDSSIVCSKCETTISKSSYIFALESDQTTRVFANPAGALFEVVTITTAQNTKTIHSPTSEFTWFPGFSWQICFCTGCSNQLGWFFKALGTHEIIDSFYAFILSEIKELGLDS